MTISLYNKSIIHSSQQK